MDLHEFIVNTLPPSVIDIDYGGGYYGAPRNMLNELVQKYATNVERHMMVDVPFAADPVSYFSLGPFNASVQCER